MSVEQPDEGVEQLSSVDHSAHDHGTGLVTEVDVEQLGWQYQDLPAVDHPANDHGAGLGAGVDVVQLGWPYRNLPDADHPAQDLGGCLVAEVDICHLWWSYHNHSASAVDHSAYDHVAGLLAGVDIEQLALYYAENHSDYDQRTGQHVEMRTGRLDDSAVEVHV